VASRHGCLTGHASAFVLFPEVASLALRALEPPLSIDSLGQKASGLEVDGHLAVRNRVVAGQLSVALGELKHSRGATIAGLNAVAVD
jgi:hypothetical protein